MAVLDTFAHGSVAVGTSVVQMANVPCRTGIWIKADAANTGFVYVGSSSAVTISAAPDTDATDGYELDAGQEVFIPVTNADAIFLVASAVSQEVCYLAL